ncbi:MAG: hypothetical protein V1889_01340 [archaeon]
MIHKKNAQIGMEYLMIIGFLTFILITTLGIAMYHNNTIRDMILSRQIESMSDKIISSAESVFYAGEPSKITIVSYVPEGISEINIADDTLFVTFQCSSGTNKVSFPSNVPITGTLSTVSGLRNIIIEATSSTVTINS